MAYQFSNQQKASALIQRYGESTQYKIAGINGQQTNADNFVTAMTGLLHVIGKDNDAQEGLGRTITQEVEEAP